MAVWPPPTQSWNGLSHIAKPGLLEALKNAKRPGETEAFVQGIDSTYLACIW